MPVTVYAAPHPSEPCQLRDLLRNASPEDVLRGCVAVKLKDGQKNPLKQLNKIWASSFDTEEHVDVYTSSNGFVHSAIRAYNAHHHLRIRPDDVWVAILSQLSIYVNTHAEALRSIFVTHQGQKALSIDGAVLNGFEQFAAKITEVLSDAVNDPTIPPWIMQEFSTTTPTDRIAAGIIMMATFQAYFKYFDSCTCGLPSVTLLGERADWVQLLKSVDRLNTIVPEEGPTWPAEQMNRWVSVLKPVLSRFVKSFDAPNSTETIDFWQRIVKWHHGGSGGGSDISGWLTAFCFWDEAGNCTFDFKAYQGLSLDDAHYGIVDWEDIPPGWATVPLEVDLDDGMVRKCRMLAGGVGITPFLARVEEKQVGEVIREGQTKGQGKKKTPRQSSGKGGFLHKLLTCCGSNDEPDAPEPPKPTAPATKTEVKTLPFPAPGEVVSLPPYPGRPATEPPILLKAEVSRPHEVYQRGSSKGQDAFPPPAYKLDGLQPRIGWWLWEEEAVVGSAPLPDKM